MGVYWKKAGGLGWSTIYDMYMGSVSSTVVCMVTDLTFKMMSSQTFYFVCLIRPVLDGVVNPRYDSRRDVSSFMSAVLCYTVRSGCVHSASDLDEKISPMMVVV